MKKMMFIAVSAIMMATATAKGEEKVNPVAAPDYKFEMNMRSLSRYLDLDEDQQDVMAYASDNFKSAVSRLNRTSDAKRPERMQKALRTNLSYAHEVLSPEQYRRYLIVLNKTMANKGLSNLLYSNEVAMNE